MQLGKKISLTRQVGRQHWDNKNTKTLDGGDHEQRMAVLAFGIKQINLLRVQALEQN